MGERKKKGLFSFGRSSLKHLLVVLISYLLFCIFISFDTEMGVFVSREMVWESKGMFGTLTEQIT